MTNQETVLYENETDENILLLSVKNPEIFSILVKRYRILFLRKAKYILKNDEDAEDIVQDAFVKIYLNASKFHFVEGATFKSWGYRILVNSCFTKYSKKKKEMQFMMELDSELLETIPDHGDLEVEKKLDLDYLLSLISKLPTKLAEVLKKHIIEGKSQQKVAIETGLSDVAVRARIHRAKQKIKEMDLVGY